MEISPNWKEYNLSWTESIWGGKATAPWAKTMQRIAKLIVIPFLVVFIFEALVKNLVIITTVKVFTCLCGLTANCRAGKAPVSTPIVPPVPGATTAAAAGPAGVPAPPAPAPAPVPVAVSAAAQASAASALVPASQALVPLPVLVAASVPQSSSPSHNQQLVPMPRPLHQHQHLSHGALVPAGSRVVGSLRGGQIVPGSHVIILASPAASSAADASSAAVLQPVPPAAEQPPSLVLNKTRTAIAVAGTGVALVAAPILIFVAGASGIVARAAGYSLIDLARGAANRAFYDSSSSGNPP